MGDVMSTVTNWQSKIYSRFRGVDFSTDATNIDDSRASDMLNMIADEAGFPSKRVGWRIMKQFTGGKINGLHYLSLLQGYGIIFVHCGTKLWAYPVIRRLRNVLSDGIHENEEYNRLFKPTTDHVDWIRSFISGSATVTYAWQAENADEDEDGAVTENDLALVIQAMTMTHDEIPTPTDTNKTMKNGPSVSFECKGDLYIMDGEHYYKIHRTKSSVQSLSFYNGYTISSVTGKIPTTGVNGYYLYEKLPDGTLDEGTWQHCTAYEEANYLQTKQINTMAGDGTHTEFWLTTKAASITKIEILSSGSWTTTSAYTSSADGERTKITFTAAPAAHPDGAGFDNIRVTFTPVTTLVSTKITHCTIATRFGYFNNNRIFVTGNPDYPNQDFMSDVDDPTFFPENGFTKVGSEYTKIKGYLHYGDILAIVKEQDNFEPEIYIRSSEEQSDYSVLYPVQQGIKGVGAASSKAFASLRDDPLFFNQNGVYAISGTDASQQRTVQNRSIFVDTRMKQERGEPVAAVWNDKYILCFPQSGHCYVADAAQKAYVSESSYVYEWYYWTNVYATVFLELNGELWYGTADGKLCKFNSDLGGLERFSDGMVNENGNWINGQVIRAYWRTKQDALSSLAMKKSLSRKGCAVMVKPYDRSSVLVTAEGDGIVVNATVDLADNEITTTLFRFEKSLKRFNTLRLTLENDTINEGFGIYGIQIRYVPDRYVR